LIINRSYPGSKDRLVSISNELLYCCVELIAKLPIISDPMLATAVHNELCQTRMQWGFPGLLATLRLAWAITIRSLSQYHLATSGLALSLHLEQPWISD